MGGPVSDREPAVAVEISDGAREQCRQIGPAAEAAVTELSRLLEGNPLLGEFDPFTKLYRTYVATREGMTVSVHYLYGPRTPRRASSRSGRSRR